MKLKLSYVVITLLFYVYQVSSHAVHYQATNERLRLPASDDEPTNERLRYHQPTNERLRLPASDDEPTNERLRYHQPTNERLRYHQPTNERLQLPASDDEPTNDRLRYHQPTNERLRYHQPTNERLQLTASDDEPTNERLRYHEPTNERLRLPRMGAKAQQKKPTMERELDKKQEVDKEREYRKLQQLRMLEEAEVGKDMTQVDAAEQAVNTATKRLKESFDRIHVIGLELSNARQDADKAARDTKQAQQQLDQHDMNKYKAKQRVDALYTELANIQVGDGNKAVKTKKQTSETITNKLQITADKTNNKDIASPAVIKTSGPVGLHLTAEENTHAEGEASKSLFNRLKLRDRELHNENNKPEWKRREQTLVKHNYKRSNFPTTNQLRLENNFPTTNQLRLENNFPTTNQLRLENNFPTTNQLRLESNFGNRVRREDSGIKTGNRGSFVKHSTQRDVNEENRANKRAAWYKSRHEGKTKENPSARQVDELLKDLDSDWEYAYGKHRVSNKMAAGQDKMDAKRQVDHNTSDPTSRFNSKMQEICLAEARVKMASMDVSKSQQDVKLARQAMQRQLDKLARLTDEEQSLQRDAQVASQAAREAQARLTERDRRLYAARQKVSATLALETDLDKYLHCGTNKQD